MADKFTEEWATTSEISMKNSFISRASTQNGRVPCDSTHSIRVAMHNSNPLHFIDIPNLDLTTVSSQGEVRPLQRPRNRSNSISHP